MTDRHFFWLVVASLVAIVVMALLGMVFQSLGLLFDILLAAVGIVAGYLTSSYFDKRAGKQNLGLYASAGYRLSGDIHKSVCEIIEKTKELRNLVDDESRVSKKNVRLMLDIISSQLRCSSVSHSPRMSSGEK